MRGFRHLRCAKSRVRFRVCRFRRRSIYLRSPRRKRRLLSAMTFGCTAFGCSCSGTKKRCLTHGRGKSHRAFGCMSGASGVSCRLCCRRRGIDGARARNSTASGRTPVRKGNRGVSPPQSLYGGNASSESSGEIKPAQPGRVDPVRRAKRTNFVATDVGAT